MPRAKISALGCYVPPRVLTNFDLEKMVETNNQWILERTGISERHIAGPEVATSDMAVEAARIALAARGVQPSEVDVILLCTVTPDMLFPSTACLVQHKLGAKGAWGFDLVAACCSFLYGLTTAAQMIGTGAHRKVLVIGADTMSRITDYTDRATCVLFGDGAGAFLVEPAEDDSLGAIDFLHEIDGSGGEFLNMPAGGSRLPASIETVQKRQHYIHQAGQQVFKFAVRRMYEVCRDLLARNNIDPSQVKVMIPHQANRRIITACTERLGLDPDRVIINIGRYGNTTSATVPLATREAVDSGKLHKADLVLFAAVGAGYTVGASLWRWAY
ncbi:MAG: beta-ketoacyl-ACP synthase III [Bryobacteraceae bacterium]